MSSTWNLLELALTEASGKDSLLAHIRMTQGDNEADSLAPFVDSMWNAEKLPGLAQHLIARYSDPKVNAIFDKALASFGIDGPQPKNRPAVMKRGGEEIATSEPVVGKRGRGRPPGAKNKSTAPKPSQTQYRDPDQVKAAQAQTAATAGIRPDRAGTQANIPSRPSTTLKPGEKAVHDVGQSVRGTSPGHTKPPIDQPSQLIQPSKLAGQLKPLKARELQIQKLITVDLQNDPTKKVQLAKAKDDLNKVQQQIAQLNNVGSSGIEDAQKRVDYLAATYGKSAPHIADDLAKKLGVPTTKQRTRKSIDKETGEEKLTVQVWNQEKVYAFMNKGGTSQSGKLRVDPELEPGVYDPTPGQAGKSMPYSDISKDAGAGRAATQIHKPMMKAPKGLDQAGIAQLSNLRTQYSKLKKSGGSPEEMEPLKAQIDQIMSTGEELVDVVRPGTRKGMRWKPSGVSQKVKTTRADQSTGNFKYGSRFTNPAEEGQEVVWDGTDWVLDSQMVAKAGASADAD